MADPDIGSKLLYRSATGLEKAGADVDGERITDINAELIIDTWNPYKTFLKNLPFLAWAWGVDIWEDGWSEETQREWTARQWEFKAKRGTIDAMRMALDFAGRDFVGVGGYIIKQAMTPPQGLYFAPGLSVEEHNAWLRLMPELRIYLGSEFGTADADQFYDDCFYDVDFTAYDNGWELYGRKAILRQQGKSDVNLKVIQRSRVTETYRAVDWEQISTRGASAGGLFFGSDFFDTLHYFGSDDERPNLYSVVLDRSFDRFSTELHLSSIRPSYEPISVTYERDSDIGQADPWLHFAAALSPGGFFWGEDFFKRDDASLMLADRLWLYDPDIATPMSVGHSYWGIDRWSFPAYHVELMIDLQTLERGEAWWGADGYWDDGYWLTTDGEHIDRACRAVVAAKSLRDRALVQFDPRRPIAPFDPVTETSTASDWVQNTL